MPKTQCDRARYMGEEPRDFPGVGELRPGDEVQGAAAVVALSVYPDYFKAVEAATKDGDN